MIEKEEKDMYYPNKMNFLIKMPENSSKSQMLQMIMSSNGKKILMRKP